MLEPIIFGSFSQKRRYKTILSPRARILLSKFGICPIREGSEDRRESYVSRFGGDWRDHSHSSAQAVPCRVFALNFLWMLLLPRFVVGRTRPSSCRCLCERAKFIRIFNPDRKVIGEFATPMIFQNLGKKAKMEIRAVLTNDSRPANARHRRPHL